MCLSFSEAGEIQEEESLLQARRGGSMRIICSVTISMVVQVLPVDLCGLTPKTIS